MNYHEARFWSPWLDATAVRLSIADERGGEYFAIVALPKRNWRDERRRVLDALWEAMQQQGPGEVSV